MTDITETELHAALQEAGIEYQLSTTAGREPRYEFYDGVEIKLHGDDWATLTSFWRTSLPRFVNVRVRDYNRALELLLDMEDGVWQRPNDLVS